MAKDIIEELLIKYNLEADKNTIDAVEKIISLGFDALWLRNVQIIKDFDILYKLGTPTMRAYTNLGIKYHCNYRTAMEVIRNRRLYEI